MLFLIYLGESYSIDLGSFSLVVKPEIHDTHPPIRANYDSPRLKYSYPIGPNGCGTWSFCRIFYQNIGMGTAMLGLCWTASIIEMVHMRPADVGEVVRIVVKTLPVTNTIIIKLA